MSAKAGWYADPGGGVGLYRYWDGKAWSAATSPNPAAAPPPGALGSAPSAPSNPGGWGSQPYGSLSGSAPQPAGQGGYQQPGGAYANYQQLQKKRSPIGWWIGAAVLVLVIVVVAIFAIRAVGGGGPVVGGPVGGPGSQDVCPPQQTSTATAEHPADGRVHGGPVSYPELGAPWGAPRSDARVPFGVDVQSQWVDVEPQANWAASILVAELAAGDGFFTPEQGAQIVVKCVLGAFYGNNEVKSNITVNEARTIDGHDGWVVESQLSFDIPDLTTKGELLIVAIVATGATAGLYYASIPDTRPDLVPAARESLAQLKVDD